MHFVVLGAAVFAAWSLRSSGAPETIEALAPPAQLVGEDARERWIDEEVLRRRAVELRLDELDTVVRRRLAQHMRFLIEDSEAVAEPTEEELEAWIEREVDRYRRPPSIDLRHVFFSRGARGERLREDAAAALAALAAGAEPGTLGDPFFGGARVEGADPAELSDRFGRTFAAALAELPTGRWQGPVESAYGLHLVQIEARVPGRPARLSEVRAEARDDLLASRRESALRRALDELRARYGAPPRDRAISAEVASR